MAGLDCVTQHTLPTGAKNGAYLRKDLRLMLKRDAIMDSLPQRTGGLQPTRMPQARCPVGRVIRQRFEEEISWHINFL